MTLVLKLDLDIIKMYVCTKNVCTKDSTFSGSKLSSEQTHRQMDRQTHRQTDWTEIITYRIHGW